MHDHARPCPHCSPAFILAIAGEPDPRFQLACCTSDVGWACEHRIHRRRAVGDLPAAVEACERAGARWQDLIGLGDDGGVVGPLADGTVIEVRPIRWKHLAALVRNLRGARNALDPNEDRDELLATYNALMRRRDPVGEEEPVCQTPRVPDEAYIAAAIARHERGAPMLDLHARIVANSYHEGGRSRLLQLATTGAIAEPDVLLDDELDRARRAAEKNDEEGAIDALATYMEHCGPRPAQPAWSDLAWGTHPDADPHVRAAAVLERFGKRVEHAAAEAFAGGLDRAGLRFAAGQRIDACAGRLTDTEESDEGGAS